MLHNPTVKVTLHQGAGGTYFVSVVKKQVHLVSPSDNEYALKTIFGENAAEFRTHAERVVTGEALVRLVREYLSNKDAKTNIV